MDTLHRAAIWLANGKRCFYCQELITFRELQIDHVIPQDISGDRLQQLKTRLALSIAFSTQSQENLVPACSSCNRRKSNKIFSETNARFFLETWSLKQPQVNDEVDRMLRASRNDDLLVLVATRIVQEKLSLLEAIRFLEESLANRQEPMSEPTVVTFSANLMDLGIPGTPRNYDRLEKTLLTDISRIIPGPTVETEASQRAGETLSVRVAFWLLDVNRLSAFAQSGWEVTEISRFSEVYPGETSDTIEERWLRVHETNHEGHAPK